MKGLLAALLSVFALAAAAGAATSGPHLRIAAAALLTLRGKGFFAHEHVRVTVKLGSTKSRRTVVTANDRTFTSVFSSLTLDRCSKELRVAAVGARGDRTGFSLQTLECPNAPPAGPAG